MKQKWMDLDLRKRDNLTIGFALIVRNEEKWIYNCLRSLYDVVDQIVVVDTGSTDSTVDIIKENFPKVEVYSHPWQGSFSEARNKSLSYMKTDWVGYIDADEELRADCKPKLEHYTKLEEFPILLINLYNKMHDGVEAYLFYPRIWRRTWKGKDLDIHFEGIVHNQLMYNARLPVAKTDLAFVHYGYALSPQEMDRKHQRSRDLLEQQISINKDDFFAHLNLAQLLRARGEHDLTIEHAKRVVEIVGESNIPLRHAYLMALDQLGTAYLSIDKDKEAEEMALKAISLKKNYLDPMITLGNLYCKRNNFDRAKFWFKKYLEVQKEYNEQIDMANLILNHLRSRFIANYNLGNIYAVSGEYGVARKYYEEVINESPNYRDVLPRLAEMCQLTNDSVSSELYYNQALNSGKVDKNRVFESAGERCLEQGNFELAKHNFSQSNSDNSKNILEGLYKLFGEPDNMKMANI